jgi:hypothetical protein
MILKADRIWISFKNSAIESRGYLLRGPLGPAPKPPVSTAEKRAERFEEADITSPCRNGR